MNYGGQKEGFGYTGGTHRRRWVRVWALSIGTMTLLKQVGSALHNSLLHLEDASWFSRHVHIYHLLSSQACFLMIRIMHTSFTFTDWLFFFQEPSTFCRYPVCLLFASPSLPSSSLPPSHLSFLDLVTCDFISPLPAPFSCSWKRTVPVNFLQTKSLYSGPAPGPTPLKTTTTEKIELQGMSAMLRQDSLHSGKGCMLQLDATALSWATGWGSFICALLGGGLSFPLQLYHSGSMYGVENKMTWKRQQETKQRQERQKPQSRCPRGLLSHHSLFTCLRRNSRLL